jgi:hypothetical protein
MEEFMSQDLLSLPATIDACIDLLWDLRSRRLEASKLADTLEGQERVIREHIIEKLRQQGLLGAKGKSATFSYKDKYQPIVQDSKAFFDYVKTTDSVDLLYKRISVEAYEARRSAGVPVPGIYEMPTTSYSLTGLKGAKS